MRILSKLNFSLTAKLIITSSVVQAALLLFLVWNNTQLAQNRLTLQKQQEISEFSQFVASTLSTAISRGDKGEITDIITQLGNRPNISYAAITLQDEQTIAEVGVAKQTRRKSLDFLDFINSEFNEESYRISVPLVRHGLTLGQLSLEFSTSEINSLIAEVQRKGLYLGMGVLVITVIVLYLLLSALTGNIKRLNTAMGQYIDNKQLTLPIVHSKDDIGKLAATFENLIKSLRQKEDSLKASQELLQAILDHSPAIIFAKDTDGRYLMVNKEFLRYFNLSMGDILGKTDYELFPVDVAKQLEQNDQQILARRSIEHLEEIIPTQNQLKTYITIKFCLYDTNGNPYAICGIATDISDRKRDELRIKESEENLRSLANNAIDGILVNKKGKHVFTNRRMAEILNTTIENILGTDQDFVLHPSEKENVVQRFKRRLKGDNEPIQYETLFVDKQTGEPVPVELTAFITQWDGEASGVVFVRDIKERKKIETELKCYREQLEQMVSQRTAQLEDAIEELESFSYSVSHDLRSPLRSIDGFSQLLLEDYHDRLDAEGTEYLNRVRKAAQRMAQLIDDILQLSRVSRHKLEVAPVNLSEIAAESSAVLMEMRPDRQMDIKIEPDMTTKGDRRLLRIVMDNLLDNACKYTSNTSHAEIQCGNKTENDTTVYFIKDNGVGFDMQYADKLFGAFQRLHGMEEFPGTGIGLATVKRIIDRHGGKVWAESQPGQGATFYFQLI